jgi:hypothetical protein
VTLLTEIADRLRADGGLLAAAVIDPPEGDDAGWAPVEAIREGYLLHYGAPRIVATDDADLALLAGDRLYALGLGQLSDLGALDAVRTLAEVIAAAAAAHGAGAPQAAVDAWAAAPAGPPPAPDAR